MIWPHLLRRTLGSLRQAGWVGAEAAFGAQGEELAYWYLRDRGFTLVARNYRHAGVGGEVDLIGWDGETLVFVEVKTRQSAEVRQAEDAVDRDKRRHLVLAARDYRRRAHLEVPYRFDVVSVYPHPNRGRRASGEPVVEHFRDAFSEADGSMP